MVDRDEIKIRPVTDLAAMFRKFQHRVSFAMEQRKLGRHSLKLRAFFNSEGGSGKSLNTFQAIFELGI